MGVQNRWSAGSHLLWAKAWKQPEKVTNGSTYRKNIVHTIMNEVKDKKFHIQNDLANTMCKITQTILYNVAGVERYLCTRVFTSEEKAMQYGRSQFQGEENPRTYQCRKFLHPNRGISVRL